MISITREEKVLKRIKGIFKNMMTIKIIMIPDKRKTNLLIVRITIIVARIDLENINSSQNIYSLVLTQSEI